MPLYIYGYICGFLAYVNVVCHVNIIDKCENPPRPHEVCQSVRKVGKDRKPISQTPYC